MMAGPARKSENRNFGILFCLILAAFGLWPLTGGQAPGHWLLLAALVLAVVAFAWPAALSPLRRLWIGFGNVLHRIVSPVVLAAMFFVVITPMGLVMRLAGRRPLRLRPDPGADSYWIKRDSESSGVSTMRNQF